jgi:dipeptidyl aminopeptidase
VVLAGLIGIIAAHAYSGSLSHGKGRRHIELGHIFNGTFYAQSKSLEWVSEGIWGLSTEGGSSSWLFYFIAGDGVFSSIDGEGNISLVDLRTNSSKILVERAEVKDVSLHTH